MIKENITLPIDKGDTFKFGKFKNKTGTVDSISKDENGQYVIVTPSGKEIKMLNIRLKEDFKVGDKVIIRPSDMTRKNMPQYGNGSFIDMNGRKGVVDYVSPKGFIEVKLDNTNGEYASLMARDIKKLNEEETPINDQVNHQQELINDLQSQMNDEQNPDKKKSLQLRLNVVKSKLDELKNKQSSENLNEEDDGISEIAKLMIGRYGKMNKMEIKSAVSRYNLSPFEFNQLMSEIYKLGYLKEALSESYMIKWNDSYIAIKSSNSTTDNKKDAYKYNTEDDVKKDLEYIKNHFKNPIKWYNVKLEIVKEDVNIDGEKWETNSPIKINGHVYKKGDILKDFNGYIVLGGKTESYIIATNNQGKNIIIDNSALNEGFGDNAIKRYFTAYKNKNNFKGTLDDFIRMYQKGEIKESSVYELWIDAKKKGYNKPYTTFAQEWKQDSYYGEEAPYQKIKHLDTDNDGNTPVQFPEELNEEEFNKQKVLNYINSLKSKHPGMNKEAIKQSVYEKFGWEATQLVESEKLKLRELRTELSYETAQRNKISDPKEREKANKYIDSLIDKIKKLEGTTLNEGRMTKKFEGMNHRQLASYIFGHPHTKYMNKIKEVDDNEIARAIKDMKKPIEEDGTGVAAVAGYTPPLFTQKRKKQ